MLCRTRKFLSRGYILILKSYTYLVPKYPYIYMSVGISPAINGEKEGQLPFWLMNIPRNQWPNQCPEFLINSSARDKHILSIPNDEYQRASWEEVQEYIRSLNLSDKGSRNCC